MLAQLGWTQSPENSIQMAADLNKTWLNIEVHVQNLNLFCHQILRGLADSYQCLFIIQHYNIPLARFSSSQGLL